MTASDHLGQQFMPVHELTGMDANDYPGTVGDVHRNVYHGAPSNEDWASLHKDAGYDWAGLHKSVAEHGITEPLEINRSSRTLIEGHHRAMVAIEQGHSKVPVKFK